MGGVFIGEASYTFCNDTHTTNYTPPPPGTTVHVEQASPVKNSLAIFVRQIWSHSPLISPMQLTIALNNPVFQPITAQLNLAQGGPELHASLSGSGSVMFLLSLFYQEMQ